MMSLLTKLIGSCQTEVKTVVLQWMPHPSQLPARKFYSQVSSFSYNCPSRQDKPAFPHIRKCFPHMKRPFPQVRKYSCRPTKLFRQSSPAFPWVEKYIPRVRSGSGIRGKHPVIWKIVFVRRDNAFFMLENDRVNQQAGGVTQKNHVVSAGNHLFNRAHLLFINPLA